MELRRELALTIGVLMLFTQFLAFGAIGLLVRMGPAIERILDENAYSIIAAERMLFELADGPETPLSPSGALRVRQALDRAKRNVTEDDEPQVLRSIEESLDGTIAGEPGARSQTVSAIRELIRINRTAMRKADGEARRLGTAGAWTAVLVGFLSFLLSLVVAVRFQKRFVLPLVDLRNVLEAALKGDRMRRCRPMAAPGEIVQVTQSVNALLDERLRRRAQTQTRTKSR